MTADAGDHFMLASPTQSSYSNETSSPQATLSPPLTTSVIDSIRFVGKMRELGVRIGEIQLERFYHELHRQSYPNLQDFVRHCKDNATDGSNDESLPSKMLSCLQDNEGNFVTTTSSVHNTTVSQSGKSIILEIELVDGESVETVISITSSKDNLVASVAVSSQVGSSVECVHSLSPAKFVRNLSAVEIVEQVIHAARAVAEDRITIRNVAFMGSGEPLHNYDSVLAACRFFESIFHLKKGRITISTVGVTPRIHDLRRDLPGVILAVNLHAPTNELRQAILPSHQYGLVGLFEALDQYMSTSERGVSCERYETLARRRAVMIEYLMVKGPTSTLECAHELGRLCWRRSLIVNLLPFLPSSPNDDMRHPPVDEMNLFKSVVSSYDVNCTVRLSLGSDIHQSRVLQAGRNLGSDLVLEPKGILTQNGAAAEKSFQALRTPSRKERRQKQRRVRKCRSEYDYKHSTKLRRDLNAVAEESDTMSQGDLDSSENAFSLNQPRFASYATPDGKTFNPCLHPPDFSRDDIACRMCQEPMAWARNSLLDCPAFLAAVSSTGHGRLTSKHLSAFYEALHHLEYPPMNQFAQMYSASTLEAVAKIRSKNRIPLEVLEFVQDPLNQFDTLTTKLCGVKSSVDKRVFRLYIEVDGGRIVETLATTYDYASKRYADISVSAQFTSQIGTSSNYNLKPFEIIAQLVHASHVVTSVYESPITIRRVYFQECGEPLLNYDNVVTACLLMSDRRTWNINAGRITISTFGVTPRIFELTRDLPEVMVSVDLVAPTQALRHSLVPWAQRYSLDGLMEAIGNHTEAKSLDAKLSLTRPDKVVIQYTMIDNETKRLRYARELGKLCKYRRLPVILVPYQRRSVDDRGRCPSMKHIHKFMAVVKSYGVSCAVKVPPGASVVDAAKTFVVRAEGSSARGSIDLRYVDNSKTQIDFWTTLASVRSECKRESRKGRRCEAKTTDSTDSTCFNAKDVSDTGLNKSKRIGDSRWKPNGVASTDVRATSRKPDNSSACHDVPLKTDPLIQDQFDPPVVCLPKLAPQTDEDSSSLTDPDIDFDYASDDILYQDGEAFECAPRPVEIGLPNYGRRELHGEVSNRKHFQLSDIPEDTEETDSSSDSDFNSDTEDATQCELGETGSECYKSINNSGCLNSGALAEVLGRDTERLIPTLDVHKNVERYSRVGYSCRRREDHAYVERESTGENKKYDSDLDYHIDVTSDKQWGDASEELLLINTSAPPCAEAKPLKITVACRSEGTRSPGSATDPAENMEWENDHAINQPAIILNDNETVVWLPHENQMPTALGVPLTSPRSTLNGSDLWLADDSERSFSSLWEVVTNSRRNNDDHPCHLLGSISSVPSASIVSVVSKFDVLYGFSPAPLGHGLKGNEKGSVYLD